VLESFLKLIFNVYEAFTAALFLTEGEYLKCAASVTFAQSFEKEKPLPIEGTLAGWVVKHNEALIIPNFDKDESALGYYREREEIKSFMGYPVETPGGVIIVDSKKKYVFTDKEKKILSHFVGLIGLEVNREKRFQEMEEKNEELGVEKRLIALFRELGPGRVSLEEILSECLHVAGGDLCFIGMEKGKSLLVLDTAGTGSTGLKGRSCPTTTTIASTVIEGGRDFLLPYNSGYLREKPLLAPDDGLKARQFFGFPLIAEEIPFGLLGFVSLSDRPLRESSIGLLKDMAYLLSLYLAYEWVKENLRRSKDVEPVTHAMLFTSFYRKMQELIDRRERFSLLAIRLADFRKYNEVMGIDSADMLLKKVFLSIEYCLGKGVAVTRSSGSHFYAVVNGAADGEIQNMLKILNYTIFANLSEEKGLSKNAVRIGLSRFPGDGETAWELINQAEQRGG
jgi:GGDEF domain-containing protein